MDISAINETVTKLQAAFGEEYTIFSNEESEVKCHFEAFNGNSKTVAVKTILCVVDAFDKVADDEEEDSFFKYNREKYFFDIFSRGVDLPEYVVESREFHEFLDKLYDITGVGYMLLNLLF